MRWVRGGCGPCSRKVMGLRHGYLTASIALWRNHFRRRPYFSLFCMNSSRESVHSNLLTLLASAAESLLLTLGASVDIAARTAFILAAAR